MNRRDSRTIAETITNHQLKNMFDAAKSGVKDWTVVSNVNKIMTKGAAWNILASNFDVTHNYHIMAKINMIREFGEFLSDELKIKKSKPPRNVKPIHQDPKF